MPYTFDDVCKPHFEYFKYHRAEQLEFDFMYLSGSTFEIVNCKREDIESGVKNSAAHTDAGSFHDRARRRTSEFHLNWLKSLDIGRSRLAIAVTALNLHYCDLKAKKRFLPEHSADMEQYINALYAFCDRVSSLPPDSAGHH